MNIISLGAGVQSTTMLLMAMHGEIEPMPDCAIFADTGWEPKAVYDHLAWLESVSTIPIHRVSQGNIRADALSGAKFPTMPLFIRGGMLRRHCTNQYKLRPIRREIRRLNGRNPTTMWLGISLDEMHRMKPANVQYIQNRWPLVEHRASRIDCLTWLERHGYPRPPKSACIGCPFRSTAEWAKLTAGEFADAVEFDAAIRWVPKKTDPTYLHSSLQPLDMVDLRTEQDKGQLDMWGNECTGLCGL